VTALRVAVADDEALARQLVRRMLAAIADAEVVGECRSGDAVAALLASARVDVLLLDVRMPGRDVFDVLDERAHTPAATMPAVIFTTAYERYAVRAFELNAVDYLVKPIAGDRLREALTRARARIADGSAASVAAGAVGSLARDLGLRPTRLLVPERGRMIPIEIRAIDWIQAEGDYARIHAGSKSYLVARAMSELERRLDPERFIRIHRSAIVNADRIKEVRPEGSSRHSVTLMDGTKLVLSRGRSQRLKRWRV